MFAKYGRNTHKEYDMFMEHIMNSRTSENVLYLYSTKKRKQESITKLFMWIDKKHIVDIKMWGKSSSIHKIIIRNFCGQTMIIEFRKLKKLENNKFTFLDDIKDKLSRQQEFSEEEFNQYFESWKKRENCKDEIMGF